MERRDASRPGALDAARGALARGDFAAARAAVEPILDADPDDAEAQDLLVEVALAEDDADPAVGDRPTPMGSGAEMFSIGYEPPNPAEEEARRIAASDLGDLKAKDDRRPARGPGETQPAPPLGVALVAARQVIGGVVAAFAALRLLLSGTATGFFVGLLLVTLALILFALARGLWRLDGLAWLVTIFLDAVAIPFNLTTIDTAPVSSGIGIALSVVVILYLVRVRRVFDAEKATPREPPARPAHDPER